jgi:Cu2+-exporting ATPase
MPLDQPLVADDARARHAGPACDHCGDALAGVKAVRREIGGATRWFCCLGCAFIAEHLHWAATTGDAPAAAPAGRAARDARAIPPGSVHAQLPVRGMVCSACALLVEHRLRGERGVARAHVDFAAGRAHLAFDPALTSVERLEQLIERAGYRTGVVDPASLARARRIDLLRVLLAWLVMMQVMMLAVPAYLAAPGDIAPDIEQLLRIVQLMLTVPVLVFSAQPLVRAALNQLRARAIGMDLPIVLGLAVAFAASVVATWRAAGPVYYDSIAMFVALVLSVRWLQARAVAAAQLHIAGALQGAQILARRLRAWPDAMDVDNVAADALAPGDRVLVAPGATVPADGIVIRGASALSQAWLTGEATPDEVACGERVAAGAVNLDQPLVIAVERAGEATSLAALRRLVDEAGRSRPRIVETANRVAIVFLWVVLGVTLATLAGWSWIDPARALPSAIAVLVATCPCALSLAAPAALTAVQAAFARRAILTARPAAIEQLARIDTLACDKTGTLTLPVPALLRIVALRATAAPALLAQAAALEASSLHPFARALARAALDAGLTAPPARDPVAANAAGVEATVEGTRLRIGKVSYALAWVPEPARAASEVAAVIEEQRLRDTSVIVLADAQGPLALFAFGESVRPDAAVLVRAAQAQHARILLLSGDRREPVARVGRELGIATADAVYALQTPESKQRLVATLQGQGRRVAMLGDGMNDAPVIAQADVSIAFAEGAALAQAQADFICLHSRLGDVAALLAGSRKAMRIVRQNLSWAAAYNLAVIPLAAFGYLTPALAAVGMAGSSLLVVGNALRARALPTTGGPPLTRR